MKRQKKKIPASVSLSIIPFLAALILPLAGFERFSGDQAPLLLSFVALAIGIGVLVRTFRPWYLEAYVSGAAMVFVILSLLGMLGLASTMPANADMSLLMPLGGMGAP